MNIPFETIIALVLLELYRGAPPAEPPSAARALLGLAAYLASMAALSWLNLRRSQEDLRVLGGPSPEAAEAHRLRIVRQRVIAVALYAALLHLFDWPGFVVYTLRVPVWCVLDDVLAVAPYLATVAIAWVPMHRADVALSNRAWSLGEYVRFSLRHSHAMVLVPWLAFKAFDDSSYFWPKGLTRALEGSDLLEYALLAATLGAAIVFFPLLLKVLMRCESMPAGRTRERLEAVCEKVGVRCRDILVWRMGPSGIMNAAVVGLLPRYRYILFSDALLENLSPEECEAVLAHELGHVLHHHTFFNLVITTAFMLLVANVLSFFGDLAREPLFATPIMVAMLVIYWRVIFGNVSRRFERQADLAAAAMMGTPVPIIMSLEKIALFSGDTRRIRNLRHGSVADRAAYLFRAGFDRKMIDDYNGEVRWMSWGLLTVSALVLAQSLYIDFSRPSGALREEERALSIVRSDPENPEGWYKLAQARVKQKKISEAAGDFVRAIERAPNHERAIRELRELGSLGLEEWRVEFLLGKAFLSAEWLPDAKAAYEKAIELKADAAPAHAALAQVLLKSSGGLYDPKKALVHARKAVELSERSGEPPSDRAAKCFVLAEAHFANGDLDAAIDYGRRARDLDPEMPLYADRLWEYMNARKRAAPYL